MIASVPAYTVHRGDVINFPAVAEVVFEVDGNHRLGVHTTRLTLWDGERIKYMDVGPGDPINLTGWKGEQP